MEKEEVIFKAAKTLFLKEGYKHTGMSQIAEAAGVATGTLYLYYPSKETLFCAVYASENARVKREIVEGLNRSDPPTQLMRHFLVAITREVEKNRILQEWYNPEMIPFLEACFQDEEPMHFIEDFLLSQLTHGGDGQSNPDLTPELLRTLLRAFRLLETNKNYLGADQVPALLELLIESLLHYLEVRR